MTDPRRKDRQAGQGRRTEAAAVRFDVVRLPSGMYAHRTSKVVIPVTAPKERRSAGVL